MQENKKKIIKISNSLAIVTIYSPLPSVVQTLYSLHNVYYTYSVCVLNISKCL